MTALVQKGWPAKTTFIQHFYFSNPNAATLYHCQFTSILLSYYTYLNCVIVAACKAGCSRHPPHLATLSSSSRGTIRDCQSHPYNECLVYHCPRGVAIHSPEEPHFSCFYQQFYTFCHYTELETKGEGQDLNGWVKWRSSSKLESSTMPAAILATHNHDSALSQHPAMTIRKRNSRQGAVFPLTEHTQRTCLT